MCYVREEERAGRGKAERSRKEPMTNNISHNNTTPAINALLHVIHTPLSGPLKLLLHTHANLRTYLNIPVDQVPVMHYFHALQHLVRQLQNRAQ